MASEGFLSAGGTLRASQLKKFPSQRAGVHVRLRGNELIGFPGCVAQRAGEFLRERLRLIVDLNPSSPIRPAV